LIQKIAQMVRFQSFVSHLNTTKMGYYEDLEEK